MRLHSEGRSAGNGNTSLEIHSNQKTNPVLGTVLKGKE